ncbi:hypothetical protein ACO1D1_25020, partial [Neobacillus sp. 19]
AFAHELVGLVVSFRKLAALSDQHGHDEITVKRAYLNLFQQMLDDAEDLAVKIGVQSLPFAFDEFIERLKDDAFELMTCAKGACVRADLFVPAVMGAFFQKEGLA